MSIILYTRQHYNLQQQQQTINNQNKLTDHIQTKNGQVMVVTFQPGHFQFLLRFLCRWFFQKMSDLNTFRTAATATVLCFAFSSPTGRCIIQPSACDIECRTNRSSWSLYSKIRKIKEDILEHEYDSKVIQSLSSSVLVLKNNSNTPSQVATASSFNLNNNRIARTRHRPKRRHVFNGTGGQAQQRSAVGTPRFTGLDHLLHTASAVFVGGFVNVVPQHLREREQRRREGVLKVC